MGPRCYPRHFYLGHQQESQAKEKTVCSFLPGAQATRYPINLLAGSSPNISPESYLLRISSFP